MYLELTLFKAKTGMYIISKREKTSMAPFSIKILTGETGKTNKDQDV